MQSITVTLSPTEQNHLEELLSKVCFNHHDIEDSATKLFRKIITSSYSWVCKLQQLQDITKLDSVFLTNLPTYNNNAQDLIKAKILAFALSLLIGEPFQYLQQNDGEVTAEVKPLPGYEHTISSGGKVLLGWHTDDCMIEHDSRAKWIQLLGVHNPDNVVTKVAFIEEIAKKISPSSLKILMTQAYKHIIPASFRVDKLWVDVVPIIKLNEFNQYEIGISAYNDVQCYSQESQQALEELMTVADACQQSFNLQPGNAIFFNNYRLLHSRDPIFSERLVLRTYMLPSLQSIRLRTGTSAGRAFDLKPLVFR